MASSLYRRAFPKLILVAAALAVGVFLSRGGDTAGEVQAAGNWTAETDLNLICTSGPALCPSAQATSAVADTNYEFTIPGTDMNFSNVVTMSAQGSCIANDRNAVNCAAGSRPILGDIVGTLSSDTNLGLTNTPCSSFIIVTFVFLNATTDNSAGNSVMGSTQAEADPTLGVQGPFLNDTYTVSPGVGTAGPGSAASGPANGLPTHVDRYPAYLNTIFDPDFGVHADGSNPFTHPFLGEQPVRPMSRYSGGQIVANTAVILTFLVFAPGDLNAFTAPHPLSDLDDANLGYASVSILQDPTRAPVPGSITDFCAPLAVFTNIFGEARTNPCNGNTAAPCNTALGINNPTLGLPNGRVRYQNPSTAGTHYYGGFHQSLRDTDNDGYENSLDTCPYNTNVQNPKTDGGPDGDMLDSSCDPGPNTPNNNQDGDSAPTGGAWTNAQDNCPLVSNPTAAQTELTEPDTTRRPRGGEQADALGDECDGPETGAQCSNAIDDDADTLINDGCPAVGSAVAETACGFTTTAEMDNDFDGWPNDGCPASGAPETGAQCENYIDDDGDTLANDGCPAQGGPELGCLNATDDDADTVVNDGCPSSTRVANGHFHTTWSLIAKCIGGTDADGDGYCTVGGTGVPNDPADNNANRIPETYSQFRPFPVAHAGSGANPPASREPIQICNDGIDNDGDTLIDLLDGTSGGAATTDDCRPPDSVFTTGEDTDGDGSRDEAEIHMGTDPLSRCGEGFETGGGPPPSRSWPQDLRGDSGFTGDKINVSDLGTFVSQARNNKSPGQAGFDRRWDIRPGATIGSWVNVADLAAISTQIPVPWMGVRAFGFFSVCSSHRTLNDIGP
jgi:hypothetical protein